MNEKRQFIDKYFATYVSQSRDNQKEESHFPPTAREVEEFICYLQNEGLDPIIVGSVALIKHLRTSPYAKRE